ncbi:Gfo/Idh/MocA family oxidoreductase [Paenibacillus pasadenensis]|uniref:Gfo/Idh/MocA family protein n=1 Tax=Paenibacillus pasadenensis TaxID=217090 RepID=UPI0020400375|nr:Gfo/Idh/MocA family oxidoreductase [Paenibacillus pasadenensis]MCM3747275.1 Gfo/Idh/MocA family oxidoreductase [Paenibacillus pasadenensis]
MKIRIAKLSYWHVHAWDYTRNANEHPDTEITAVWDELPQRGQEAAEKLGVPFYSNLDEVLARDDIDAVIVDAPTSMHRDVMVKAARAGKHIFTEKVVAPTTAELNDILKAVEEAGVKLTVSLPRLYDAYTVAIRDVLAKGLIGEPTQVRVRMAHDGAIGNWLPEHFYTLEQTAGGAMIDLGCHPMYLTSLFLGGLPEKITASYGYVTGREVEDNAIALLSYPNGAIGVVEAGFSSKHSPFQIEISGTQGTLLYGMPEDRLLVRSEQLDKKIWSELPLAEPLPSAFSQWVSHIQNGTVAEENLQLASNLTRLMEAANLSAAQGRSIQLSELSEA